MKNVRLSILTLVALLSLVLSGCVYEPALGDLQCSVDDDCPNDSTCEAGLCVAADADAGADMQVPPTDMGDGDEGVDMAPDVTISRIEVTPDIAEVGIGLKVQLTAQAFDENDVAVDDVVFTWSSGSEAVATVDTDGAVEGVSAGMVQISAAVGDVRASALVTVLAAIDRIEIAPLMPTVGQGLPITLTARALDAGGQILEGRTFTWATQDAGIADIDENTGQAVGVTPGTVEITASSGGVTGTTMLEVTDNPVAVVEITPEEGEVEIGSRFVYTVVIRDGNDEVLDLRGRTYEWTLSDGSIAALSNPPGTPESVRFDAQQLGPTELSVTVDGGASDSLAILVIEKPVMSVDIVPLNESVPVGSSRQLQTEVLDFGGMPIVGRAHTWSSSDDTILSVDAMGVVTAHQPGSVTITVEVDTIMANLDVDAEFLLDHVDIGNNHTCGVNPDGVGFCWGKNDRDQIGNSNAGMSTATPLEVEGDHVFTEIWAGDGVTCGLDNAGTAFCWGRDGATGSASGMGGGTPVAIATHTFTAISIFHRHGCGITTAGEVYCWGEGDNGELGDGQANDASAPVKVDFTPMGTPNHVAVGRGHSCVLTDADKTYCWGNGFAGALGTGDANNQTRPAEVSAAPAFVQLTLGVSATCARTAANDVFCWGSNTDGLLGVGNQNLAEANTPTLLPNVKMIDVSLGDAHGCGINAADDVVHCWGQGSNFKLGTGAETAQFAPVANSQALAAVDVSGGRDSTCAANLVGQVYCWGDNTDSRGGTSADNPIVIPAFVWPKP